MTYQKVKNLPHLHKLLVIDKQTEFAITLKGGVISRKTIKLVGNKHRITNHIDNTTQTITDLFDERITNVGKALMMGALVYEKI